MNRGLKTNEDERKTGEKGGSTFRKCGADVAWGLLEAANFPVLTVNLKAVDLVVCTGLAIHLAPLDLELHIICIPLPSRPSAHLTQ